MKNKEKVKSKVQIVGAKKGVNGKNNKGITLIALVITIIVLIILAGVSINLVLGENGLFTRARKAAEDYQQAAINEQEGFNALYDEIGKFEEGNIPDDENPSEEQESQKPMEPQLKNYIGKEKAVKENTKVYDQYNNLVVIPTGFHIVSNGENNVVYQYTGNSTPSVQDGIVIEDNEGNQFVWIPVGTINNKEENAEKTTTITLGRYTFDETNGTPSNPIIDGSTVIENNFTEDTSDNQYGNTIAKDIEAFKKSANDNGGYYLARYEASYNDGTKPLSQQSTGTPAEREQTPTVKGLWNNIQQPQAATAARAMYADNSNFTSDLVNSYAWDTAIVFIQKYSGNSNYANETSKNSNIENTGERTENTTDKVCNIYDMASNCYEWSTESCGEGGCTTRGANCGHNEGDCSSKRSADAMGDGDSDFSFRVTLYLN